MNENTMFTPYTLSFRGSTSLTLSLAGLLVALLASSVPSNAQNVHASVDATATHAPISPWLYGQFLEHIGDIVNDGLS